MSDSLFNMESVLQDSPRLQRIKAEGIQTQYFQGEEDEDMRWIAVPMKLACELVHQEFDDLFDLMGAYCSWLDDCGFISYGATEKEAQDKALHFVEIQRKGGAA